jgi:hypothetical protein
MQQQALDLLAIEFLRGARRARQTRSWFVYSFVPGAAPGVVNGSRVQRRQLNLRKRLGYGE